MGHLTGGRDTKSYCFTIANVGCFSWPDTNVVIPDLSRNFWKIVVATVSTSKKYLPQHCDQRPQQIVRLSIAECLLRGSLFGRWQIFLSVFIVSVKG